MKQGMMRFLGSTAVFFAVIAAFPAVSAGDFFPPPPDFETVAVTVRNGQEVAFSDSVALPGEDAPDVPVTPASGTADTIEVSARSVLAILMDAALKQSSFSLSHVGWFDFGSPGAGLYIKCVTISSEACDNWQYTVNGVSPSVGAGVKTLSDGDTIFLYFGNARQVAVNPSSVAVGQSFTATAQAYDPSNDTFSAATGLTIGVFTGSSLSPTEVATSSVNASGQAAFTLNAAGAYGVGIQEDFYFPSVNVTVSEGAPSPSPSPSPSPAPSGNRGGGDRLPPRAFDVPAALAFLAGRQNADGSFSSALLSDWAAIAFGSASDAVCAELCREARGKLRAHLSAAPLPSSPLPTDLERRIMALEALGIDPYAAPGSPVDALAAAFDGAQVGDASLVNDDIFALFPLTHAGYASTDPMIEAIVSFVLSKQRANGSWENSVDLTAAAIQALAPFSSRPGVAEALSKAERFLGFRHDDSGTFGSSSFSLSWVLQAIAARGQTPDDWKKSGITPLGYLGVLQQEDGGVEPLSASADTRVWATSYAVPAALALTWNDILQDFARPAPSDTPPAEAASTSSLLSASPVPLFTAADSPRSSAQTPGESAAPELHDIPGNSTALGEQVQVAAAAGPDTGFALPPWDASMWLWLFLLLLILYLTYRYLRSGPESREENRASSDVSSSGNARQVAGTADSTYQFLTK